MFKKITTCKLYQVTWIKLVMIFLLILFVYLTIFLGLPVAIAKKAVRKKIQ